MAYKNVIVIHLVHSLQVEQLIIILLFHMHVTVYASSGHTLWKQDAQTSVITPVICNYYGFA